MGGQPAAHVAVERAVPDGQFGFVARGQWQVAVGVGEGHHGQSADAGLDILVGNLGVSAGEQFGQPIVEGVVHVLDGHDRIRRAEILREPFGVGDAVVGAVSARHEQVVDVLGSEGVGGEDGDDGGVDPAG